MKFTQIPANPSPAVGDYVIGHTVAGVDDKLTISQLAALVSANLGAGVMKFIGATSAANAGAVIPPAYTSYNTVSGTSNGGRVLIRGYAAIKDGNSGAGRTGHVRLTCDGVVVGNSDIVWWTFQSGAYAMQGFTMESHTPSAGAHTWALQVQADTGSASIIYSTMLEVIQALA